MTPRHALAVAALLVAAPAVAHVRLVSPPSRYGDEMKFGPCGRLGGARSANVTTLTPGQDLIVVFDEVINHPGHYRIAFDPAGDDALAPPTWDPVGLAWNTPAGVTVLADLIPDAAAGLTHGAVTVTLPDVECTSCTLQLIQVMTDKPPLDGLDEFYFQCADLVLTRTPGPPPPAPVPAPAPAAGGCGSGGDQASAPLGLLLLLVTLAARRARDGWPGRR